MLHKSRLRLSILFALIITHIPAIFASRYPGDITIQQVDALPTQAHKNITFMVYMAADNSLADFANSDIVEMASVGSSSQLNVLTYLSTKKSDGPKVTKKLFVQKGYCIQDGDSTPRDSGDAQTLIEALTWAIKKFPSDRFVLVLWNHGSGSLNRSTDLCKPSFWWMPAGGRTHCAVGSAVIDDIIGDRSVCYDDSTGNYLTDDKLRKALSAACQLLGKKIDIIAFDACLMADAEIAFTLQPYADYVVASQQTIPGDGYGYGKVLSYAASGNIDSRSFAKGFVDAYEAEYHGVTDDYTLCAIDTSKVAPVVDTLNHIANSLKFFLREPTSDVTVMRYIIKLSRSSATHFTETFYIDLLGFYKKLLQQVSTRKLHNVAEQKNLIESLKAGIQAINDAVFAQARGALFAQVGGLSIYFDSLHIDSTYPTLYWSQHTQWLTFLQSYIG